MSSTDTNYNVTTTCTAYLKSIKRIWVALIFIFCIYMVSFIKLTGVTFLKKSVSLWAAIKQAKTCFKVLGCHKIVSHQ